MNYGAPSNSNYLESLVKSAPPARLRLMLIEKGIGLCLVISDRIKASTVKVVWDEQSLHLFDVLNELLSGVSSDDIPVTRQVADLYVFLLQHLNKAITVGDYSMIDELRLVLETEAETWRLVCAQSVSGSPDVFANSLGKHGEPLNTAVTSTPLTTTKAPLPNAYQAQPASHLGMARPSSSGSLNLQG